jgi:carbon monoxide dehydrogenase subunit G
MRKEIRVEAPIDHVWTFLLDTSQWEDWMPRGQFSDFTGPLDQVGSTYVQTMRLMGFEMKSTSTVVEVDPPRLYHEHTDQGPMETYIRLEPEGDATRVIMESDYEWPAHMPGFVKDFATRSWIDRNSQNMIENFKAMAEATVPVPA